MKKQLWGPADGFKVVNGVMYLSPEQPEKNLLCRLAQELPKQAWYRKIQKKHYKPPFIQAYLRGLEMLNILVREISFPDKNVWPTREDPYASLNRNLEPDWLCKLPDEAQAFIRRAYATGEGTDPRAISPNISLLGFGYLIPDCGLSEDAVKVFRLARLMGIRQLSFLHDPVSDETTIGSGVFNHTRYCHSLDTYALAGLIAHILELDPRLLNTLLTAAISHDALTPAGGDSVKLIDPEAFDEDINYPKLLVGKDWEEYRERYGIDRDLLVETILGRGLLGQILDLSDKCAYLARDIHYYANWSYSRGGDQAEEFGEVMYLAGHHPDLCALWQHLSHENGRLVIEDPEALTRFLRARAGMFRSLYYNPHSRFFEYMLGKGVVNHLYRTGRVTRRDLLTRTDAWLEEMMNQELETQYLLTSASSISGAWIETFPDQEQAKKRAAELASDPRVIVIADTFHVHTSDGTRNFQVRHGGQVMPYAEARPEQVKLLKELMSFPAFTSVFVVPANKLHLSALSVRRLKRMLETN
ncbi:MAG: hypothetical protein WCT02_03955 [Candidatus Paceibacterota bacterium]